jgi:hypothetical protein
MHHLFSEVSVDGHELHITNAPRSHAALNHPHVHGIQRRTSFFTSFHESLRDLFNVTNNNGNLAAFTVLAWALAFGLSRPEAEAIS